MSYLSIERGEDNSFSKCDYKKMNAQNGSNFRGELSDAYVIGYLIICPSFPPLPLRRLLPFNCLLYPDTDMVMGEAEDCNRLV